MSIDDRLLLFGPSHPVMTQPLRAMIRFEADQEIGQLDEWLDPWNTQQYLGSRWGLQLAWATARISSQTLAALGVGDVPGNTLRLSGVEPGHHNPWENQEDPTSSVRSLDITGFLPTVDLSESPNEETVILNSQPLAEELIQHSICFGEGPRFQKERIDVAAQNLLAGLDLGKGV
ncbi:hypothetical protein EG329_003033 [Mollisiaceae sp. DMI_Dod_QoI]|nr:hypothetical protein EG329_003033 [Helotiales sp. DMI_Dod_QoI]